MRHTAIHQANYSAIIAGIARPSSMKRANIQVRRGQLWKKKDTGRLGLVVSSGKDRVKVVLLPQRNRVHDTRVRDLQMFWTLVG